MEISLFDLVTADDAIQVSSLIFHVLVEFYQHVSFATLWAVNPRKLTILEHLNVAPLYL